MRIPDNVDDFTAGPIMCSGSTIYRSVSSGTVFYPSMLTKIDVAHRISTQRGRLGCIPRGGGGVDHMSVQIAKAMGLRVIAIDGGEEKREICLKKPGCERCR